MRTACSAARLQQQESSGSSSQGHDGCDSLSGCALGGSRCSGAGRGGGSWGCLGGVGACGGVLGDLLQDVLWERTEVGMQNKRLSGSWPCPRCGYVWLGMAGTEHACLGGSHTTKLGNMHARQ